MKERTLEKSQQPYNRQSKTTAFRDQPINLGQQEERKDYTYMHWSTTEEKFIGMIIVCDFFLLLTHMRGKFGNLNYTMNIFSVLVTMEIGNKFCIQKVNRIDIQRVVAF